MEAAGPGAAALELALRGAALLALALAVSAALPGARASLRHAVLAAALIGQFALPVLDRVAPAWEIPLPDRGAERLPADDAVGRIAASMETPVGGVAYDDRGNVMPADAVPASPAGRDAAPVALALVWLAGAALFALRLGLGVRAARGLAARARPVDPAGWASALREAAARAGLPAAPPVRLSDRVSLPFSAGLLRPVVVLPAAAAGWSARRRVLVLTHEFAHVGRGDVRVQVAARLACAAFWFDPLAWLALARLRAEAERAADDAVLRGEPDAGAYVRELAGVLRGAIRERRLAAAVGLGRGLEARVRRAVALSPRAALSRPAAAAVVGAALAATAAVASVRGGAAEPAIAAASGCDHVDGRHVDRWAEIDGALTWQVLWEGRGCEVELLARPDVALVEGILVPASPGGEVRVRTSRAGETRIMEVRREPGGALTWREEGGPSDAAGSRAARFRALAREIDRHTGFDAEARVPALLAEGGPAAVFDAAARTQGGHAAGAYLDRLLDARALDERELARVLDLAAEKVASDAVMESLLSRLAREADVTGPALRGPFERALATLESPAAREAVLAAIS